MPYFFTFAVKPVSALCKPNDIVLSYGRLLLTSFHFHAANCLARYRSAFLHMTLSIEGCHFLTGLAMPVLVAPVLHFHFISFYLYASVAV